MMGENMHLTNAEEKIKQYCEKNADRIYSYSIGHLASEVFTTPSTISKLSRKMGFNSFIEFKVYFKENYSSIIKHKTIDDFKENYLKSMIKVYDGIEIEQIKNFVETINPDDKLIAHGQGSSLLAAHYLRDNLLRMGYNIQIEHDFFKLSLISSSDSGSRPVKLIIFSHSGETKEIFQAFDEINMEKITVYAITMKATSSLGMCAKSQINYANFNLPETPFSNNSYVTQVMVCDLLLSEFGKKTRLFHKFNAQY